MFNFISYKLKLFVYFRINLSRDKEIKSFKDINALGDKDA